MNKDNFVIQKYSDEYKEQILDIWEKSVLATHDFLTHSDFQSIKEFVKTIDFNSLEVYCLVQDHELAGFLGVANRNVEMLFLSPYHMGKGLGKKLLQFAIEVLNAHKVDVNEQNYKAVNFYQKMGFITYERTEKDDQGKDYPLLRMALQGVIEGRG